MYTIQIFNHLNKSHAYPNSLVCMALPISTTEQPVSHLSLCHGAMQKQILHKGSCLRRRLSARDVLHYTSRKHLCKDCFESILPSIAAMTQTVFISSNVIWGTKCNLTRINTCLSSLQGGGVCGYPTVAWCVVCACAEGRGGGGIMQLLSVDAWPWGFRQPFSNSAKQCQISAGARFAHSS